MTIPWIKCSERMPPDDDTEIIVKSHGYFTRHEGSDLRAWLSTDHAEWIPFDEATWRECCLPVSPDNKL